MAREVDKESKERQEAEARSSPSGSVVYQAVLQEGLAELDRPTTALFWSGLAAGLSMGASLIAEGLLARHLPQAEWRPLLTKLGYSVGFLVVLPTFIGNVIGGVALVAALNHAQVVSGNKEKQSLVSTGAISHATP